MIRDSKTGQLLLPIKPQRDIKSYLSRIATSHSALALKKVTARSTIHKVLISSTFYGRIFHMNVVSAAFSMYV